MAGSVWRLVRPYGWTTVFSPGDPASPTRDRKVAPGVFPFPAQKEDPPFPGGPSFRHFLGSGGPIRPSERRTDCPRVSARRMMSGSRSRRS